MRCLLLRFHNGAAGLCCPSYDALQDATGFCRQTIAKALRVLEAMSVLTIVRRLVRVKDAATGIVYTRQSSSLYAFRDLAALVQTPVTSAQPLKSRVFGGRVYRVGTKHQSDLKTLEQEPSEVLHVGHITVETNPPRLLVTVRNGKTGYRVANTMRGAVPAYKRIRERYPEAGGEDYLFLPQYPNRATASRIIQRQFNLLMEQTGLKHDAVTNTDRSIYSLRHTAICMRSATDSRAIARPVEEPSTASKTDLALERPQPDPCTKPITSV